MATIIGHQAPVTSDNTSHGEPITAAIIRPRSAAIGSPTGLLSDVGSGEAAGEAEPRPQASQVEFRRISYRSYGKQRNRYVSHRYMRIWSIPNKVQTLANVGY